MLCRIIAQARIAIGLPQKMLRVCEDSVKALLLRTQVSHVAAKIFPLILPKQIGQLVQLTPFSKLVNQGDQTRHKSTGSAADKGNHRVTVFAFGKPQNADTVLPDSPCPASQIPEFARGHLGRVMSLGHET